MPNERMIDEEHKTPSHRGFAAMNPEQQRDIARKGGKAAHEKGTAHEFTPDEARAAGRKGGMARAQNSQRAREMARASGDARALAAPPPSN